MCRLAAMADVKERAWREQIQEGNPHLMPTFVADMYTYVCSLPQGGPVDYARLRSIVSSAASAGQDAGSAAWQARQAARKRRREAAAAEAAAHSGGGGRGARRRVARARRGSSGGAGGCAGMLTGLDGGCAMEE